MFRDVIRLAIGITAISFGSIFIKFCDDVPPLMIATYRLTIASILLLLIARIRRVHIPRVKRSKLIMGMIGGIFLSLHFYFWVNSLKLTSVASSVVLVNTNPIFVGILSLLILKEKQPAELIIGIILSFAGSVVLALGDSGLQGLAINNPLILLGDIFAILGSIMASGYLMIGSKLREEMDVLTYITIVYSFSALFLLLASIFSGTPFVGYKASSYVFMILLAVVPQLIGHTTINWALKHFKTSMVAITILGEPIGASILAYILLHETINSFQGIGIALIFAAIIVASRKGVKYR